MENKRFIEKYQKKLSHILAGVILCTIWGVVGVTEVSKFINQNYILSKNLHTKTLQIENIIKNKQLYAQIEEITLKKIIKNILSNSSIFVNDIEVINLLESQIQLDQLQRNSVTKIQDFGILLSDYSLGNVRYSIVVEQKLSTSAKSIFLQYLYFVFFSLPVYFFLYFISHFFLGKSFNPLKKNISNLQKFSSDINHELKTPLSEILSSLQLFQKNKDTQLITTSIHSTQKLSTILDSLSTMATFIEEDYKKQKNSLREIFTELERTYAKQIQEKQIEILYFQLHPAYIYANKEHLEICFSNILSNAIKYSEHNNSIDIHITKKTVTIQDYGIGIDEKNTKKIFHHYFRESYIPQGTGIGLSIVQRICEINGWKIEVSSKKGQGSSFTIIF